MAVINFLFISLIPEKETNTICPRLNKLLGYYGGEGGQSYYDSSRFNRIKIDVHIGFQDEKLFKLRVLWIRPE
jgi:hypothetical protein